jgi:hypothetical protein
MEELGLGSAGLEQVKEGDMVSVSYDAESMEALSIDVLPVEEPVALPVEEPMLEETAEEPLFP